MNHICDFFSILQGISLLCDMLQFANAKINIGLHVTNKRPDGYHDIETIFYPVKLYDVLEVLPSTELAFQVHHYDFPVGEDNLCVKAYRLLAEKYDLPAVSIHLLKNIPVGAGLGGGSSDAAHILKMLDQRFELNIAEDRLMDYASRLGADCPFFIRNKPMFASGIGTELEDVELDLSSYSVVIIRPDAFISTAEAYQAVIPKKPEVDLKRAIRLPIQEWKYHILNDFELGIFKKYPYIQNIKAKLYEEGAIYASMSGSGSAVFGIFETLPEKTVFEHLGQVFYPVDL